MNILTVGYPQPYSVVSLSSEKCSFCKSLRIIESAKRPEWKWRLRRQMGAGIEVGVRGFFPGNKFRASFSLFN